MSIGERIADLRKAQSISQGQLADALNVSRQAISKWENDLSNPDSMNLIHLADILDTDVEYLVTGKRTLGRRPPIVIKTVETVEKIVEKPVVQVKVVEKIVDNVIEKPVIQYVEKPVIKKQYRIKYKRNLFEYFLIGFISLVIGIVIGSFL